jgi:hypothetical protein
MEGRGVYGFFHVFGHPARWLGVVQIFSMVRVSLTLSTEPQNLQKVSRGATTQPVAWRHTRVFFATASNFFPSYGSRHGGCVGVSGRVLLHVHILF